MQLDIFKGVEWIISNLWSVLQQIGGVAIATGLSSAIAYWINANHEKKISHKYNTEIERLKTRLDVLSHESNMYFDAQFATYQELCRSFFEMVNAIQWLFPIGYDLAYKTDRWEEICEERYSVAQTELNAASNILGCKAPFITKDEYELFLEIVRLSTMQIYDYPFYYINQKENQQSADKIKDSCQKRNVDINEKWERVLTQLRERFDALHHKNDA